MKDFYTNHNSRRHSNLAVQLFPILMRNFTPNEFHPEGPSIFLDCSSSRPQDSRTPIGSVDTIRINCIHDLIIGLVGFKKSSLRWTLTLAGLPPSTGTTSRTELMASRMSGTVAALSSKISHIEESWVNPPYSRSGKG